MELEFNEEKHEYTKGDKKYISVSKLLDKVKNEFDADEVIDKMLKGQEIYLGTKSDLLGLNKEQIKQLWDLNRIGKSTYGSYIHSIVEAVAVEGIDFLREQDKLRPEFKQAQKFFKNEGYKLIEAEKRVHSDYFGIAGTMDLLLEKDGMYFIGDWKTNLDTDLTDFTGDKWTKSMKEPLSNIPDLKYWGYALQMSLYRYILENEREYFETPLLNTEHNEAEPLEFGGQFIIHLQESQKNCKYNMKQITYKLIQVPYLKDEVELLLKWKNAEENKTN